jgi:hypothetical protein
MKSEDISKMASAALVTLVITLAAFGPEFIGFGAADAANDDSGRSTRIENPKLVAGGVEMRLASRGNLTFKDGEEPVFELTAINTTDQAATVTVEASMTSTPKPPRLSRTPARPVALWQNPITISLGPRETKIFSESTQTTLPVDSRVDVYLRTVNTSSETLNSRSDLTTMMSFSTIAEQPALR